MAVSQTTFPSDPTPIAVEATDAWRASELSDPAHRSATVLSFEARTHKAEVPADGHGVELPERLILRSEVVAAWASELDPDASHDDGGYYISDLIDEAIRHELARRSFPQPFTYAQQCGGALIQNLTPQPGQEMSNSNAGRVAFGWHADDSILSRLHRTDNIMLVGVDNPTRVPTRLLSVDAIVAALPPAVTEVLQQPRFRFGCPESFEVADRGRLMAAGHPILQWLGGQWHIRFASFSTTSEPGDEGAALALAVLLFTIDTVTPEEHVLGPGTMLLFSNSRFLHSRGEVSGRRWIKRLYLRSDLTDLEAGCATAQPRVFDLEAAIRRSMEDGR